MMLKVLHDTDFPKSFIEFKTTIFTYNNYVPREYFPFTKRKKIKNHVTKIEIKGKRYLFSILFIR
jgi:hypothetical protein